MTRPTDSAPLPKPDLIEEIARQLPVEIRAAFYAEMRHCRSLPEHDEMLRILKVMMILTKLMVDVPARILDERNHLETLLTRSNAAFEAATESSVEWHKRVDVHLRRLPDNVATGIQTSVIATKINESLRQQFTQSTIPQTAKALEAIGDNLRTTTRTFQQTAEQLGTSYRSAVSDARQAIRDINVAVTQAATSAHQTAQAFDSIFHKEYRWTLVTLCSLFLAIGLIAGMFAWYWIGAPTRTPNSDAPAVVAPAPRK